MNTTSPSVSGSNPGFQRNITDCAAFEARLAQPGRFASNRRPGGSSHLGHPSFERRSKRRQRVNAITPSAWGTCRRIGVSNLMDGPEWSPRMVCRMVCLQGVRECRQLPSIAEIQAVTGVRGEGPARRQPQRRPERERTLIARGRAEAGRVFLRISSTSGREIEWYWTSSKAGP